MTTKAFAYYRTSSSTNVSSKDKDGDKPKKKGLSEDKDSRAHTKPLCATMPLRTTLRLSVSSNT